MSCGLQALLKLLTGSPLVSNVLKPVEGTHSMWPQLLHLLVGHMPWVAGAFAPPAREDFLDKVCHCA